MSDERTGTLAHEPAAILAGILGVDAPRDILPPMWHTVYLLDRWARAELGHDGHPLEGLPRPPSEPHRRMFAGGRARHLAALRFDEQLTKRSEVISTVNKQGRSGPLTFVTVRHEYLQGGQIAVVDEHDLVYRPLAPDAEAAPLPAVGEPEHLNEDARFEVDPVTLFLFSGVTANAHRIHYDLPFAQSEGHPDLVVHGPLQVLLMAGALEQRRVPLASGEFSYRLLSPARGAQVLRVGAPQSRDADVVVLDGMGMRVARASVTQ